MKRQHYRPFNPEQAQAGAPYGYINNDTEVKIYEYFDTYCVAATKVDDGPWLGTSMDYNHDYLVMLPIATCQGKPVFVGDALYDHDGMKFEVAPEHGKNFLTDCTWEPVRARVETKMTDDELDCEYRKFGLHGVANTAIQRAIEDGYVAPISTVKEIAEFCQGYGEGGKNPTDVMWAHVKKIYLEPKMSKYTPGPWKVYTPIDLDTSTYGIDSDDGEAVVFYGDTKTNGIQKIANARLIAAAPELLEALEEVVRMIKWAKENDYWPKSALSHFISSEPVFAAAIAKATGEN